METQTVQPSFCDWCRRIHDVITDHCAKNEHCTSTTASCAAALSADDHSRKCCDCKADNAIKVRR